MNYATASGGNVAWTEAELVCALNTGDTCALKQAERELARALDSGDTCAQEYASSTYRPRLVRDLPESWTRQFEGNPSPEDVVDEFLTRKLFEPKSRTSFFESFFNKKRRLFPFLLGSLRNFARDKGRSAKTKPQRTSLEVHGEPKGNAPEPWEVLAKAEPQRSTEAPRTLKEACKRLLALIRKAKQDLSDKRYIILLLDARIMVARQLNKEPGIGSIRTEIEGLLPWEQDEKDIQPVKGGPCLGDVWSTLISALAQGTVQEIRVVEIGRALGASVASIHQWRRHARRILREASLGEVGMVIPDAWAYQGPRTPAAATGSDQ
jgi:hypothetical protein